MGTDERGSLTVYTVSRISKQDVPYGPAHGSMDANKTICGRDINSSWFILTNGFDGSVTCKKCLKSSA